MKSQPIIRTITLIALVLVGAFLLSCAPQNDSLEPGTAFQVTFVDYDDAVLKTVDCVAGTPCDIVPPNAPDNKENTYFTRWSVFPEEFGAIQRSTTIRAIYTYDNRVLVIGDRAILWYSFTIMLGIMTALYFGLREAKRLKLNQDALIDGFLWIVPVAILGARLWYVMFELDSFVYGGFFPSLLRVLGFSSGRLDFSSFGLSGLAIHGAFFTGLVCAIYYTKKRKLDLALVLDLVAVGFIYAQTFGRWGNFMNQEAHGPLVGGITNGVANLTLKEQFDYLRYTIGLPEFIVNNMYISRGLHGVATAPLTGYYHPTFFYELTLNWLGFFVMLVLRRLPKVRFGDLMGVYLVWYGTVRIFIESLRTDPLTFELFGMTIKSAQATSVLMIIGGIALWILNRKVFQTGVYGTIPGHFRFAKKH
jgi:phosphatidylglycerol:prolipoprotein diacylglycerol transferase